MEQYDHLIGRLMSMLSDQAGVVGVSVEFDPSPILYVDMDSSVHRRQAEKHVPRDMEGLPVKTRVRPYFIAQVG
jgi:hypothetical protein